jgi:hypothetical protein
MKYFIYNKIFKVKWQTIMIYMSLLLLEQEIRAQYISNQGIYLSISQGTYIGIDTIDNDPNTKLSNQGNVNVNTLKNAGTMQGDGTYNIAGDFTNSGTFYSDAGTVIMNGVKAQTMTMALTTVNNLIIDNAVGVTLNSNQTTTNNLTINTSKIFNIQAGKSLTVEGLIENFGGSEGLVLRSSVNGTASLIHNTDNVPATVQLYMSGAAEDLHFLSAPVSNQEIGGSWNPSGTYGNGTGYDLYIWNEPTPCWIYQLNKIVVPTWTTIHPSSNFIRGLGYLYSTQEANPTKEFIGSLNNGTMSYPVTNEGPNTSPDPDVSGFNLIGNPYPSDIDWNSSGWIRNDLLVTSGGYDVWIWNPQAKNYGVYNTNNSTLEGTNGVSKNIAAMQGFYVRAATNGDVGMSNSIRANNASSKWLKTNNNNKNSKNKNSTIKVRIASDANLGYDEVLLQFGASSNEPGSAKLFSNTKKAPSLYLMLNEKEITVLNLTNTVENKAVQLMFKAGCDEKYTLSFNTENKDFETLLLEDKKTNTISDLNSTAQYTFKGSINDDLDRFVLHFAKIKKEVNKLPVIIYYDGHDIHVDLTLIENQTTITVYDILGRMLLNKKVQGKKIHRLLINLQNGIYIVKVNENEKSMSRKILVY